MRNKIRQFLKSNFYTIYWIFNPNRTVAITPRGIYNYFQAHYRKTLGIYNLPAHVQEQIIYRSLISKCSELEYCQHCGCPMEDLFFGNEACKDTPPCFPAMMNADEWLVYCRENNVEL